MPPAPTPTPPITPRPARMLLGGHTARTHRGAILLALITLIIAVTAFYLQLVGQGAQQIATDSIGAYAVRVHDGLETLVHVDAQTGAVTDVKEITDAEAVLKNRFALKLATGTTITTNETGIIAQSPTSLKTIVASVTKPKPRMPIAVSATGDMVAWVAPGDHSLQIFHLVAGAFAPLLLEKKSFATSLAFSSDKSHLLMTTETDTGRTEVWSVDFKTKDVQSLFETDDLIIFTNGYE